MQSESEDSHYFLYHKLKTDRLADIKRGADHPALGHMWKGIGSTTSASGQVLVAHAANDKQLQLYAELLPAQTCEEFPLYHVNV
jgi:hypothetical protein